MPMMTVRYLKEHFYEVFLKTSIYSDPKYYLRVIGDTTTWT